MLMVWKASGICFLAPACPISLLQVDSWALGVLLYTLVYGTMPFDGFDHKNLIRQISSGEYREPTQPSGACRGRVRGWAGGVVYLSTLTLSASVLLSGRSLLLFLFLFRSLTSGKAHLLGCFTQTFPNETFKITVLCGRQARSPVCSLCEPGQIPDSVRIQFLH